MFICVSNRLEYDAFHKAVDEMAEDTTFRGYGPEQGYEFLREAIAVNDFRRFPGFV